MIRLCIIQRDSNFVCSTHLLFCVPEMADFETLPCRSGEAPGYSRVSCDPGTGLERLC